MQSIWTFYTVPPWKEIKFANKVTGEIQHKIKIFLNWILNRSAPSNQRQADTAYLTLNATLYQPFDTRISKKEKKNFEFHFVMISYHDT